MKIDAVEGCPRQGGGTDWAACRGAEGQIRWISSARDDTGPLSAWRAAVGPPVIESRVSPPTDRIRELAVVSWNTRVGGGDLARLVHDLRSGDLVPGRRFEHFVLLLQEVYRADPGLPRLCSSSPRMRAPARIRCHPASARRRDIVEEAQTRGLDLVYVPSMRNGRSEDGLEREDRGNAILATLPLCHPTALELPLGAQRRVAVLARVCGTSFALDLASVHLDVGCLRRPIASLGRMRAEQAKALLDAIGPRRPLLLGGDFNTWMREGRERAIQLMLEAFGADEEPPRATTSPAMPWARRLDYLFLRSDESWSLRYAPARSAYGSDHRPLVGSIHLTPQPGGPNPPCAGVATAARASSFPR